MWRHQELITRLIQLHPDKSSPCCHTYWLLYFPLKHNTTIFYKLSSGNHFSTPLKLVFHKLCFIFMLTINVIMWRLFVFLWPFTLFRGIWPTHKCAVSPAEIGMKSMKRPEDIRRLFIQFFWMIILAGCYCCVPELAQSPPMSDTACSTVHCRARCMKVPRLQ